MLLNLIKQYNRFSYNCKNLGSGEFVMKFKK